MKPNRAIYDKRLHKQGVFVCTPTVCYISNPFAWYKDEMEVIGAY